MRKTLCRGYLCRVKKVLRTVLYGRNKVLAINKFTLPVLTYSFRAIHWRTTDLQHLNRWTRKLLSTHGVHHSTADDDRLYAPCTKGGRRLRQIKSTYQFCIVGLDCYLCNALISLCKWYKNVMLGCPLIRFVAWPVSILHSCRGVSLTTTSRRVCMEVGQSCLVVSLSKHLRQMRNSSVRAAFLFVYSPGSEDLCMVSIAVSQRSHLWA